MLRNVGPMDNARVNLLPSSAVQAESLILAALGQRGSRMTRPRRRLASILACQTDSFSAEEVAAAVPGLGRATVYRTLRLLADADVLCKAGLPQRSRRYTLNRQTPLHQLTCVDCGRAEELPRHEVERALSAMAMRSSEIVGLRLYHRCGRCEQYGQAVPAD